MLGSILLLSTLSGGPAHDFGAEDAMRWITVNDTVMGGESRSQVSFTPGGTMVFSGDLSLENNGGFTSVRSVNVDYDLAGTDGVEVSVLGDGRTYIFSLELAGVPIPAGGYWQEFSTRAGEKTTSRLPYSQFVPTSFGRSLKGLPAVDPAKIRSMQVYLYDKKAGPFRIELDSIAGYVGNGDTPAAVLAAKGSEFLPKNCSTLASLLAKTGLDRAVSARSAFTLFAPTDAAFAALPKDVVDRLLAEENAEALEKVLLHHVLGSTVTAFNAVRAHQATALDGGPVRILADGDGIRVNGARVVEADLLRGAGVVHVIDAVLVPEDLELAAPPMSSASASKIFEGAIRRGVPLFNEHNEVACAAIYATAIEAVLGLSRNVLDENQRRDLRDALARSETQPAREASWTLRRAIDSALTALRART